MPPVILPRLLLLIIVFLAIDTQARDTGSWLIGKPRPDIILPDLQNKPHGLDEWRNKVLVINFWATWCLPCRKEIPLFNRVQAEYAQDVVFIGLALDNTSAIKRFMETTPIQYPVLVAGLEGAAISEQYGNEGGALPYTVIVDRNGLVRAIASGLFDERQLRRQLDKLLN